MVVSVEENTSMQCSVLQVKVAFDHDFHVQHRTRRKCIKDAIRFIFGANNSTASCVLRWLPVILFSCRSTYTSKASVFDRVLSNVDSSKAIWSRLKTALSHQISISAAHLVTQLATGRPHSALNVNRNWAAVNHAQWEQSKDKHIIVLLAASSNCSTLSDPGGGTSYHLLWI
jgi:hypothetical protein